MKVNVLQSQQTNEGSLGDGPPSTSNPRTLPVVGAAAAVSYKETRNSLAEFTLTGKVKVWQASSDQDVQSEMTVEEKHPRNLAWPLKNKYGMSCACDIQ
jgi:hypothetical protein